MLRAGMHHASDEVSTARLPRSGTAAQNCRSSNSAVDSTMTPASASFCSCPPRIFRRPSISWDIFSNIWRTALTFTSPRSYRSRANLIARCSARRNSIGSLAFVAGACAATAASACRNISCDSAGSLVSSSCKGPGCRLPPGPETVCPRLRQKLQNSQDVFVFGGPGRNAASRVARSACAAVEPRAARAAWAQAAGAASAWPSAPGRACPAPRWITPLPGFAPE